jgi:hypothetical protein
MDDKCIQKANKIIADWEKRRPVETPETDVYRLLDYLDFVVDKKRGSHVIASHTFLTDLVGDFVGPLGRITFVPHHSRRFVKWFDLRQIIFAAKHVIEKYGKELDRETHS